MKKRISILASMTLFFAINLQAQVVDKYQLILNNDRGPIEATIDQGELVVKLEPSDVVNFDFQKFANNSKPSTIEIVDKLKGEIKFSKKTTDLKFKNKFELKLSELGLPPNNDDNVYYVSMKNENDKQVIFRFKMKS